MRGLGFWFKPRPWPQIRIPQWDAIRFDFADKRCGEGEDELFVRLAVVGQDVFQAGQLTISQKLRRIVAPGQKL